MASGREIVEYENQFLKIIGLRLAKVEYVTVNYELENPEDAFETDFANVHSVDFAVFLYGVNSETIEIKWDGTFFQYGIGVTINKPSDYRGHNTLDVSKTSIWQKLVGQFIMDIEITWEEFGVATLGEPIREGHYPQWIKLKFSNDQDVIISAAELRDSEEKALVFMDNLLVIDDVGLAKKLNSI